MNDERIEVTLKCGHSLKYHFYGPQTARDATVAWINTHQECRRCRLSREFEERMEKVKALRNELGVRKFPELIAPTTTPWGTPLSKSDSDRVLENGRRGREKYIEGHEDWATLNDPEVIYGIVDEVQNQFAVDFWRYLDQATNALSQHNVPTTLKRYAIENRKAARFWSTASTASQIELIYEWAYDLAARGEAEATQE